VDARWTVVRPECREHPSARIGRRWGARPVRNGSSCGRTYGSARVVHPDFTISP
jgi:hypothetical protein